MNFRFLHAADLHLGSPFLGLAQKDSEVAVRFARASRTAFEDLVTKALEEDVALLAMECSIFQILANTFYEALPQEMLQLLTQLDPVRSSTASLHRHHNLLLQRQIPRSLP